MKTLSSIAAAILVFGTLWISPWQIARADAVVVSRPARHDAYVSTGPNRPLIRSGLWTLGVSYLASVVVAAESSHPGDRNLFVPVAGPWMDLANRGDCNVPGSCNHENLYRVFIVADGVVQALGALQVVAGVLFPETRVVNNSSARRGPTKALSLRVSPLITAGNYGVAARGTF